MEEPIVLVERIGRVGIVTLNRPKQLNALDDALMDALGEALLVLDGDDGIGVLVVTGGPKAFAAGADIAAMADWTYMDVYRDDFITRNWETIRRVRKPVIAAVAGFAMGGGCELALACDIVIAAESARFALPEVKLAMLPGAGGTQRLPRAIGKAKAMDMVLTGRLLSAHEAEQAGLVARVTPGGQWLATAREVVDAIFAKINSNGTLATGKHVSTASSTGGLTPTYTSTFDQNVSQCAVSVVPELVVAIPVLTAHAGSSISLTLTQLTGLLTPSGFDVTVTC